MIKRFFCIFIVLIIVFSFPVEADTVYDVVYEYSSEDFYNDFLQYSSTFDYLVLDDDICYFDNGNANRVVYHNKVLWEFGRYNTCRLKCEGSNMQVTIQVASGVLANGNPLAPFTSVTYNAPFEVDLKYVRSFNVVVGAYTLGEFSFFKTFTVTEIPDVPPESGISGDSSDFHSYLIPFVSNLAIQTWDVFSSSWWVLAFILMPLVYLLIISFIKLFSYFLFKFSPKYRIRYLNKYKNNYKVDFNDKYAPDFGHLSIFSFIKKKKHNKNNNDFKRFVYVDGVKYYRSNSNLKKIHTFKKDTFVEKTKYHNKKYDVDIDVEDS